MSGIDSIQAVMTALEAGNFDEVSEHLSGDFIVSGWTTQPYNKNQFLQVLNALKKSVPDLAFHMHNFHENYQLPQSDQVEADMHVTGTQAKVFSLSPREESAGSVASRALSLPVEHVAFTVMGQSIESMVVTPVEEGGLKGILAQLQQREQGQSETILRGRFELDPYSYRAQDKRYNKQSNLYDPEYHTYTPSHNDDYAPQVDAYAIEQQKKDRPDTYLFENLQQQSEYTQRDSERPENRLEANPEEEQVTLDIPTHNNSKSEPGENF